MKEPSVKLKSAVLEILYLLWLGFVFVRAFAWTTMFKIKWTDEFMWWVTASGFAIAFFRAAVGRFEKKPEKSFFPDDYGEWKTWQIMTALLLALFMIRNFHRFETDRFMLMTLAAVLGAKGIEFRKIAGVFFAVTSVFLVITLFAARAGNIENLVYANNATHHFKPRLSYGIVYPTDFAAHVFFTGTTWVWIRGKKITYPEIAVIFMAGGFAYWKNDAWMTSGLLVFLGAALIYFKIRERKEKYRLNKLFGHALVWAAPVLASLMLILSTIYREPGRKSLINRVNKILHYRLMHASRGLKEYPLKWFGQTLPMNGLGGRIDRPKDYFFIDSSYPNIILRYGVGIFLLIMFIWVYVSLREKRNQEWQRLLILALIAVACFMEHHLMEIAFHPYLLLIFAASGRENVKNTE